MLAQERSGDTGECWCVQVRERPQTALRGLRDSIGGMKILVAATAVCLAIVVGFSAQLHGAPQTQAKTAIVSANTAQGQTLFNNRCAICHYDHSEARKIGPGLKGIYGRGKFADGRKINDASMIARVQKGGEDMPGLKDPLKPDEIRALIAYLRTL
jgi:mono/diheme cytochrome c family protein